MRKLLAIGMLLLLNLLSAAAVQLDATWRIVVRPAASETERFAARELQEHIRKITGLTLPIEAGPENGKSSIVIDGGNAFPELAGTLHWNPEKPENDQYVIRFDGRTLYLAGNSPRGALYAVYAFLRDVVHVHWLWPGESGTFLPDSNVITIPDGLSLQETAAFQYRGIHWCRLHYDSETELWGARNQLNIVRSFPIWSEDIRKWNDQRIVMGYHMMVSLHNVQLPKEYFEAHPEWFALADGKRHPEQLCWSNPEVVDQMVKNFCADIAKYPAIEIMSIFPADSLVRCHCPECDKHPTSELWFSFLKKIIAGIRNQYPEMKFSSLAYQIYQDPPPFALDELDFIEYAMYDRCYVHPFAQCNINAKALTSLERWRRRDTPVGIYGYAFDMFETEGDMFVPWFTAMQDALLTLERLNVCSVITEGRPWGFLADKNADPDTRQFNRNRILYYLYCRLLWNPNQDVDALVNEYCTLAYGPAAETMRQYFQRMSQIWDSIRIEVPYNFYAHQSSIAVEFLSGPAIAELDSILEQAHNEAAAASDSRKREFRLAQVDMERKNFDLWKLAYQKGLAEKQKVAVPYSRIPDDVFNGVTFPEFTVQGKPADYPTRVRMIRDDNALYWQIVCEDPQIRLLQPQVRESGGKVWEDESIELFLASPGDPKGQYRHFVVNGAGAKFQEIVTAQGEFGADAGSQHITDWQPEWTAKVRILENAWELRIKIPFHELGAAPPAPDEEWRLMIIRTAGPRQDYRGSGFPTAAYHDYNSFGRIVFAR